MNQRTIAEKVSCTGIGLHGGQPVQLTLHPARADSGIVFVRTDLEKPVEIPARCGAVVATERATSLGRDGVGVQTVEHLLAALRGLGVDDVRAHVDGPELPVMDGSAEAFVYLIRSAGLFEQAAPRRVVRLTRRVEVRDGDRSIVALPAPRLQISYAVDYPHPAIRRQSLEIDDMSAECFEREIAGARTFGFLREVEKLWKAGLGRGGSFENTLLLDDDGVANPEGLRWPDEFVRHKVLDLVGDLALLGASLVCRLRVERGGHALHRRLLDALRADPAAWQIVAPVPAA